ncbi:MAG: FG-GAP-like repeat-containing protein [Bacteroidota bacterium]
MFAQLKKITFVFLLFCTVEKLSAQPYQIPGFPIVIDSLNFAASQPSIADLDEDGKQDIVVSKNSPPFLIFAYNINGEVLEGWPQPVDQGTFALASGDIDGDGHIEVIARTLYSVFAFRGNGELMSGFPVAFATQWDNNGIRTMVLYDFHHNNTLDIITASFNKVLVYDHTGAMHTGFPKILPGRYAKFPSIADINLDGEPEIVINSTKSQIFPNPDSGWLNVLTKNGEDVPGWPVFFDSNALAGNSPTLCNVNGDDSLEIISPSAYRITPEIYVGRMHIFSPSGILLKKWHDPVDDNFLQFDETSIMKNIQSHNIIYAVSDWDGYNFLFDENGEMLPGWPLELVATRQPKLVDIDNDTIPEIFLGRNSSPNDTGAMYCVNIYGQHLPWSPFKIYGNTGVKEPLFSDLDKDGSMEMVTIGAILDAFDGYALNVFRFPGARFTTEGSPWPQKAHDSHNTYQYGYVPSDNVVGIAVAVSSVPEQFSLKQNYPNPFNPQTAIGFSLLAVGNVTLKVYDVLGREVQTLLNNERMEAGRHVAYFNVEMFHGTSLPSGVYFYRLNVDGKFSETKKLVLTK